MQKHRRSIAHSLLAAALFAFIFATLHPFITHAATHPPTPSEVLYLGKLTNSDGDAVPDGTYQMKFGIYFSSSATPGDCLWGAGVVLGSDTGCAASQATRKSISVAVEDGFFSVKLGAANDIDNHDAQTFPSTLFDATNYSLYLGVTVCGVGSDQLTASCTESEMGPRKQLISTPFALRSRYSEQSSGDFSVGTSLTTGTTVTVGTNLGIGGAPSAGLTLADDKDILGTGTASFTGTDIATAGVSSAPSKIIWNPTKGAFRVGSIGNLTAINGFTNGSAYWDTANLGPASFATGVNNKVTGAASAAFGLENTVTGLASSAFGMLSSASGDQSFATGFQAIASGSTSTAIGEQATASGNTSIAIGGGVIASNSTSIAIGSHFTNNTANSFMIGFNSGPTISVDSNRLDILSNKDLRFNGSNSGTLSVGTLSDASVLNLSKGAGLELNGSSNGSVVLKAAATGGGPVLILPSGVGQNNQILSITGVNGSDVSLGWADNGGASGALSALTAATNDNTINNTANAQQRWNFQLTSDNKVGLRLAESSASTGSMGDRILAIETTDGSTAQPLYVMSKGPSDGTAATIYSSASSSYKLTATNKALDVGQTSEFDTSSDDLTAYGASITNTASYNTNDPHTLTNVGLYVNAENGYRNYAAIFENGNVGIGTTAPSAALDIKTTYRASEGDDYTTLNAGGTVTIGGGEFTAMNNFYGVKSTPTVSFPDRTVHNAYGLYSQLLFSGDGSPIVDNFYGLYVANWNLVNSQGGDGVAPGVQNKYAIGIEPDAGSVGIGTITPTYDLSFGGTANKTIGVERNTTSGAGRNLTVLAGAPFLAELNTAGGDLTLSSGTATGNNSSNILFKTASGGLSGTDDSTPTTKLTLNGAGDLTMVSGSSINCPSGTCYLAAQNGGTWSKTGYIAEPVINTEPSDLEQGDILALALKEAEKGAAPVMYVRKATSTTKDRIVGIMTNSFVGDDGKMKTGNLPSGKQGSMADLGSFPAVKVTNENGAVEIGDLITVSSRPGIGMKATQAGTTVGVALQAYDQANVGTIKAFIRLDNVYHGSSTTSTTLAQSPNTADGTTVTSPLSSTITLGTPSFVSGRTELTDALKEVTVTLPTNFATAVGGNYQAFITSTTTPAALFISSQTNDSFTVRSMDGISFGPFNWMALAGTTVASTTEHEITPDSANGFENIPVTPGALESPTGPLSGVLDSAPVQTANDAIPPIAAASFAGFVVSGGVMVRSAGRKKGIRGYLKSFLVLPSVLTRHSAQGFSRMASPNETGIIDHSYTRFARWHFAAQVLLLIGVNLLLVRAILGIALKALA